MYYSFSSAAMSSEICSESACADARLARLASTCHALGSLRAMPSHGREGMTSLLRTHGIADSERFPAPSLRQIGMLVHAVISSYIAAFGARACSDLERMVYQRLQHVLLTHPSC
ncbi:hypothetical protein PsYK624_164130 [Phanerochaete sordida]|uniref:Uncharacterized protein n=1 Tax=Phanerochaete sordida TaxID=48140 RepID=A0A9P3GS84_9APHY|nr:hypothetical protein PsYK624_164130 [Phanerochaete sordida]